MIPLGFLFVGAKCLLFVGTNWLGQGFVGRTAPAPGLVRANRAYPAFAGFLAHGY